MPCVEVDKVVLVVSKFWVDVAVTLIVLVIIVVAVVVEVDV